MIQDCSVAERKFEIAARAVYVDVPCVEYVGERLQDRPELEFVIVVFYIFCDFLIYYFMMYDEIGQHYMTE